MTSNTASNYLGAQEALTQIGEDIAAASVSGLVPLPPGFELTDLEKASEHRRRARSTMKTPVLSSFAEYVELQKQEGAAVFVDEKSMSAVAVLNIGTAGYPGHCDDTAEFNARIMSPFKALQAIATGKPLDQKAVAEFMEDWSLQLTYESAPGTTLTAAKAITAVRNLTVDKSQSTSQEVQNLGAKQGTLSSVQTRDAEQFPALLTFKCEPYFGFPERSFVVRVGILTGPTLGLVLRIVNIEKHQEEMAIDLVRMVTESLGQSVKVLVGTHAAIRTSALS